MKYLILSKGIPLKEKKKKESTISVILNSFICKYNDLRNRFCLITYGTRQTIKKTIKSNVVVKVNYTGLFRLYTTDGM